LSIWDTFCQKDPKKCSGDNGNEACDHYNRVVPDISLMKAVGINSYRMSLSWSRFFPSGRGTLNKLAVDHYDKEITALSDAGIRPYVTLYHWDLPQWLEDQGGWLNASTIDAFVEYANTTFRLFGDRVKNWATFNEPLSITWLGYGIGLHAPGRCSDRRICTQGDSSIEPYVVGHNILLSHANAAKVYKDSYQKSQNGRIGFVVNSDWAKPLNESDPHDQEAAQRWVEFSCGWFADPIMKGDYPASMKQLVGARLPAFTAEQQNLLKTSVDVFFLNHYTSVYATMATNQTLHEGWEHDTGVFTLRTRGNTPIGPPADSPWLYVVPDGIRSLLKWVRDRYGNPEIVITENGVDVPDENKLTLEQALNDTFRIEYYSGYLQEISKAIKEDKVVVTGYFAWSLMDNFEWLMATQNVLVFTTSTMFTIKQDTPNSQQSSMRK